jgi:hypothetical protein
MALRSICSILGWSTLSVPCQAPVDCSQEGAETVHGLLCGGSIAKWGQQGLITGGFSHGQHGQLS